MFQPEAKLHFVQLHCPPADGWRVYVDIDASEEGRTGGVRATPEAQATQLRMQMEGELARKSLIQLGAQVGGSRVDWFKGHHLPPIVGDRDILAFHPESKRCLIAEVEGASTGQPEQKLYKAIGQLVMATSETQLPPEWSVEFVLVVVGDEIARHLARATSLKKLGISALSIDADPKKDRWLF
jgi:hypothetical protein